MKLADVSIKRPVFATVMIAVLVVFGVFAYPRVGVDLFPDVEFPVVVVTAVYPGADPETVESRVVDKLEEAVSTVNGIKVLRSTSMESVGQVVIQFELERKADQAVQDVRDKVSIAVRDLPKDLDPPVVQRFDTNAAPIFSLALSGKLSPRELYKVADDTIKARLQTINGVGGVDILGGRQREFEVWIDPNRLESYSLAVGDVMQALGAQNVEIPGGRLDIGKTEMSVRTKGQVHSKKELEDIIIVSAGGAPVRIGDVARVEDGIEEERSYSAYNGNSAIALIVRKQSGSNTVQVAKAVRKAVDELRPKLPRGASLAIPTDNATFIENSINDVQFDLIYGGILAILIILFFLHDWRATLISALALPVSVIATFAFVQAMGFTFNMMTMLALSLSIGILIDDAIVVIENIYRHLEEGAPPLRAAAEGTGEIGLAVLATTASILAVFVPVATMQGIIGRFFKQFGATVAFAVAVSLFVAFTLTPTASARMLKAHAGQKGRLSRGIERFLDAIEAGYKKLLAWALGHRAATIGIAVLAFAGSLVLAKFVPTEFMATEDRGQFSVKLELPTGTALAVTERYADEVALDLRKVPGVTATFVTVGGSGTQSEVTRADIQVNMVPKRHRMFSQAQAVDYVRKRYATRTDALFAVEPLQMIGGGSGFRSSVIQYNLRGSDYGQLNQSAQELTRALKKAGGYVDLDTSYRGGKPEVAVDIDRDRAADLGVPIASIAMTIRMLIAGDKATELTADGDRFDVRLKLDEAYRQRPEDLLNLKVRSSSGQLVSLANVVSIAPGAGPSKIDRQNRQRQITLFANLDGKTLGQAIDEVNGIAAKTLPAAIVRDWAGMGDVMKESFGYMFSSLLLAVIIVYLVLAAQFESFVHPLTIMLSLPLSLVGALGALAITRQPLGIMSMIGVIMLMGLVTKNAILLVDYTNTLRNKGLSKTEALMAAGPVRLRPILMTTAAMIFGMIPVATGMSEGGEMRAPMAITVIGGLITSTFLTLVVVPVAYSLLDSVARKGEEQKRKHALAL
jgi:hydrophobic/amphiphilic exporter-1 (mainly G- bacteria), HAE1 family